MKKITLALFLFFSSHFSFSQTWTPLGPDQSPPDSLAQNGLGIMMGIAFHPTDSNTFWMAGSGGVWKTTDNATSWHCLTDNLPIMSGIGIDINPNYPDSMLVAGTNIYGTYQGGIFRSTDGGVTWDTASILPAPSPYFYIKNFFIMPNDHQVIIVCTNKGIYKSVDAGVTWTLTVAGQFTRCLQNPTSPNILYATTYFDASGNPNKFYRSLDYGDTWTEIAHFNGILYGVDFAVTPADPNLIQVATVNSQGGLDGLYKSTNGGVSFTEYVVGSCTNNILGYSYTGNSCGGQAGYDLTLLISPTNANTVFIGAIYNWKSTDGGTTWNLSNAPDVAHEAVHQDKHYLKINPLTNDLYEMNDGGASRSSDMGVTWDNISNTLNNVDVTRLTVDYLGNERVLFGQQDDGNKMLDNTNQFRDFVVGDGFCAALDPVNPNVYYTSTQYGSIQKTIDNGLTWTYYQPATSFYQPFKTNFMLDPTDHNTIVYVGDYVYMSTNAALNWTALPNLHFASSTSQRCVYVNYNNNVRNIYASDWGTFYHTNDDGLTWNIIIDTTYGGNMFKSGITISNTDPNAIWVTVYGQNAGQKVFKSADGGVTWTNVSGSLPNVNMNCILYENNSNQRVYIGTDLGVYYRDSTMSDWARYNTGMPIARVTDLAMNCSNQHLYASTLGRGLWKTNCNCNVITSVVEEGDATSVFIYPNPVSETSTLQVQTILPGKMKVDFYDMLGELVYSEETDGREMNIRKENFSSGLYLYRVAIGGVEESSGKFLVR